MRLIKPVVMALGLVFPTMETVMAIEETPYTVAESDGQFELRQYAPHIVAETLVEGNFDGVGNEGFRRLAGYIFGDNRSSRQTLVTDKEPESEKIAMTAPVNQTRQGETWRVTFTMPAEYSYDELPKPLDSRVQLKRVQPQLVAAFKYSGTWSKRRYDEHEAALRAEIEKRGLTVTGEPIFARYNPPFMPWFVRRNEVLIPVNAVD